ncbi:MAG: hypothetical protein V7742_19685 [Halioglobus sp.]
MSSLMQQLHRNLLAVISLTVALTALGYNTYRNELSEANRNTRYAGFAMLQELAKLQLLADYAHYDSDPDKGNPITGWGQLLYLRDMGPLVSKEVLTETGALTEVWTNEWRTLRADEQSNQRVTAAIDKVREKVRRAISGLD